MSLEAFDHGKSFGLRVFINVEGRGNEIHLPGSRVFPPATRLSVFFSPVDLS
jgi:hypothetical protein